MDMPLWVGLFLTGISLVCFTGWFFGLAAGLKEVVLDDQFFIYRIFGASAMCIALFAGSFFVLVTYL